MAAAVLAAAVAQIGGAPRAGQQQMAAEVSRTVAEGEHLLVQAGTGTGKSLGYLAPALAHLAENPQDRVVIATATLAGLTEGEDYTRVEQDFDMSELIAAYDGLGPAAEQHCRDVLHPLGLAEADLPHHFTSSDVLPATAHR